MKIVFKTQQLTLINILLLSMVLVPPNITNATQANKNESLVTIATNNNQTFATLIQQAELLASKSIEQKFLETQDVTEVSVTVVGERNGQEVPLLFAKVSRFDWQAEPKIQHWAKYFGGAEVLLGFLEPKPQTRTTPVKKRTVVPKSFRSRIDD